MRPCTRNRFVLRQCQSPYAVHRPKNFIHYFFNHQTLLVRHFPLHSTLLLQNANKKMVGPFDCSGLTLIELMIVIGILATLATISIPNILGEMPKFRLNGAAQQVVGDLMAARMRAVSQNKSTKVFFINGNQYKICDDTGDNCVKTVNIQDNFKGVTLDIGNNPTFSPRGTASNKTINIINSYGKKTITVAITGRVKLN